MIQECPVANPDLPITQGHPRASGPGRVVKKAFGVSSPRAPALTGLSGFSRRILVNNPGLGVFLGLLANQWREDHSDRVRGRRALAGVSLEIRANRKILAKFHENNRTALEEISGKEKKSSLSYLPALQLESSSWKAFLSAGVSNAVDYEKIRLLSRVYSAQEVYTKSAGRLIDAALNMSAFAAAMGKKAGDQFFLEEFRDYLEVLFKIEEELLASYKKALDSLGGEGG